MISRRFIRALALCTTALLGTIPTIALAELDVEIRGDKERTTAKRISAVISAINPESREITLKGALGNFITIVAGPEVERFDEFEVGDLISATYVSSISGELRAPTEQELVEPIVYLDAGMLAGKQVEPGAAAGLAVRAVCTIESMNRATGTVMLKDPEGDFHIIEDVDPANMAGVALGDTIIVTYTQAFALKLEKHAAGQ